MERRGDDDDSGTVGCSQGAVQAGGPRKVPEVVGAECSSQPCGVYCSGTAMIPALLTRMSNGPLDASTNPMTEAGSARSSGATKICLFSGLSMIMVAAATAALASEPRTARVTSAPALANARAVSEPSPEC